MASGTSSATERAHVAVLVSWILLATCTAVAAAGAGRWPWNLAFGLALLAPLLLPVPGLLNGRPRTHAWAALCVAPAMAFGLTEVVANPAARFAAAALLLASLAAFVALVAYLRVSRRAAGNDSGDA